MASVGALGTLFASEAKATGLSQDLTMRVLETAGGGTAPSPHVLELASQAPASSGTLSPLILFVKTKATAVSGAALLIAALGMAGGATAAYRREIEAADDPDAKRQEIEDRLNAIASPFRTAEATGQDIIDPRETRPLLAEFVADAQRILASQVGPPHMPYLP